MEYQEILEALQKGLTVKWRSSRYHIKQDKFNRLLVTDIYNGYTNALLDCDLEDCFI